MHISGLFKSLKCLFFVPAGLGSCLPRLDKTGLKMSNWIFSTSLQYAIFLLSCFRAKMPDHHRSILAARPQNCGRCCANGRPHPSFLLPLCSVAFLPSSGPPAGIFALKHESRKIAYCRDVEKSSRSVSSQPCQAAAGRIPNRPERKTSTLNFRTTQKYAIFLLSCF